MFDSDLSAPQRALAHRFRTAFGVDYLLGSTRPMHRLGAHLLRVADAQCPALIRGETGSGKELLAAIAHRAGPRRAAPCIPINCAALTVTLAESQLFGHERGAFTGAAGSSLGVFRAAAGGVVILDEIGDMPLALQPKLLRVLEQREVMPVGAARPIPVDAQVIAVTNRNLEEEVAAGRFREDLYYRLNLVELVVPPLRERVVDIPDFIEFFHSGMPPATAAPSGSPTRICCNSSANIRGRATSGNYRTLSSRFTCSTPCPICSTRNRVSPHLRRQRR